MPPTLSNPQTSSTEVDSWSRYTRVSKWSLCLYIYHPFVIPNSSSSIGNLTTMPWVQMVSMLVYCSLESVLHPVGSFVQCGFLCAIKLILTQIILTNINSLQVFWGNFLNYPPWISAWILLLQYISGILYFLTLR